MTEIQLLRDSDDIPTEEVLENALGKSAYALYIELMRIITSDEFGLNPEWNYYKDGKAWLCKVIYKKKTVFWLSVWENHVKTGFYFTEKTSPGIFELAINDTIKQCFSEAKPIGKLIPLTLRIENEQNLDDLKKIIHYKKRLK